MTLFASSYTANSEYNYPDGTPLYSNIPIQLIKNSLRFFETYSYDTLTGAYFSDLEGNGKLLSRNIQIKSLSRLVYAMAYSSEFFPENLDHAKRASKFICENMIKRDRLGLYFISTYLPNGHLLMPNKLHISEQAFGLSGLVELYSITKQAGLLAEIHELFDSFITRFYDEKHGGFFDYYSVALGKQHESKSFESTVYPLSIFLFNLWKHDVQNRAQYEPYLTKILDIADRELWDNRTGWVNIQLNTFNRTSSFQNSLSKQRKPGHNFQLAKTLLQAGELEFLPESKIQDYKLKAEQILSATMLKPIWDNEGYEGFFSDMYTNQSTNHNRVASHNKSSWQHAEAIGALSYFSEKYDAELKRLTAFFYNYFVDVVHGGEYLRLTKDNEPMYTQPLGCKSKASYHTVEMLKCLIKNVYSVTLKKIE